MFMDDIKLFAKMKKKWKQYRHWEYTVGYRDGIWHRQMCYANNEKIQEKSECSEKRKRTNTWDYCKQTTIKQVEMKEKTI